MHDGWWPNWWDNVFGAENLISCNFCGQDRGTMSEEEEGEEEEEEGEEEEEEE